MEGIKIYRENYQDLPERFVKKIESDLQYLVEAGIPGMKKVYLFGSCARGEVRSSSDVDLLVYTEHRLADRELAALIRWTLDEPVQGVRTDVVYKNEDASSGYSAFERAAQRDRKLILEVGE